MLEKIRAAIPGVALRTSFIVGFPGETDDDFGGSADFVAAAEFDHLGVFLYSNEETARVLHCPEQVPASRRSPPAEAVMALQRKISRRNLREMVGKSLPVLVEGPSEETELLFQAGASGRRPGSTAASLSMISKDPSRNRGIFAGHDHRSG